MTGARVVLLAAALTGAQARAVVMPAQQAAPVATAAAVTRTLLQRTDVPGSDLETRLYLITFPPASSTPLHTHPVVGLGYILRGEAVSAFEGETPRRLVAGQSFQDLAGTPHILFRNASATDPLVFLIAYTVRKGEPVTVFDQNP